MKAKHPLALIVMPDVPEQATALLEAQGHLLYTMAQVVQAGLSQVDGVVGVKCWRILPEWWMKDDKLAPHAQVMLKAITTQAYPDAKKPKAKGKRA